MLQLRKEVDYPARLYAATFVATIPIWVVAHVYKHIVSNNGILSSLNSLFIAQYGYLWLVVGYAGQVYFASSDDPRRRTIALNGAVKFAMNALFTILIVEWFFGALLIERLNSATGGHCQYNSKLSMEKCRESTDATWVDGFDLSGHYFFTITLSMLILDTLSWKPTQGDGDGTWKQMLHDVRLYIWPLSVLLLLAWYFELCITSIFFHTIAERALGLVTALAVAGTALYVGDKAYKVEPLPEEVSTTEV